MRFIVGQLVPHDLQTGVGVVGSVDGEVGHLAAAAARLPVGRDQQAVVDDDVRVAGEKGEEGPGDVACGFCDVTRDVVRLVSADGDRSHAVALLKTCCWSVDKKEDFIYYIYFKQTNKQTNKQTK